MAAGQDELSAEMNAVYAGQEEHVSLYGGR
jgi:hypothetical protein